MTHDSTTTATSIKLQVTIDNMTTQQHDYPTTGSFISGEGSFQSGSQHSPELHGLTCSVKESTSQVKDDKNPLLLATRYLLLAAWMFCAPTNLFYKLLPNFGFVGGLQIDYLIPKLYLIDIIGLTMIGYQLLLVNWKWFAFFFRKKVGRHQILNIHAPLRFAPRGLTFQDDGTAAPFSDTPQPNNTTTRQHNYPTTQQPNNTTTRQHDNTTTGSFISGEGSLQSGSQVKDDKWRLLLAACYLLLFVRQFFTPLPIAAVWFFVSASLHLATFFVAHSWWEKIRSTYSKNILVGVIAFTMLFQSTLGLYQFVAQRQLVGFTFFGEPTLTRDIGLSKSNFAVVDQLFGTQWGLRILPYGTTPHPNVLGGFLALGIVGLVVFLKKEKHSTVYRMTVGFCIFVSFIVLLLTTSISAWAVLGIGIGYQLAKSSVNRWIGISIFVAVTVFVPFFIHIANNNTHQSVTSLTRRDFLNQQAVLFFRKQLLLGIGMNQFTVQLTQSPQNQTETIAFVQPVHHVPLLLLTENGLLGVLGLFVFVKACIDKTPSRSWSMLLLLLPILTLDHYGYSLTPGQSILLVFLTLR